MSLEPGQRLSHYRLIEKIGEGGMGEVYRAEDTRLGREVALKTLSADTREHPERLGRLQREARAVAALNHPGIVTIHSVDEAEGIHFITMELIEGRTLDRLIPKGGLPLEKILEIAVPLASALEAAHARGITHRDLKPSNVIVADDGRLKVLDFGLAKLRAPGEAGEASQLPTEAITREGIVVGTLPYMSPEQLEGRAVDHRSDLFSLGTMLYEMASGSRPFQGGSSAALMSSIMKDTPRPLEEIRPRLPRHLGRIIGRCLGKEPADRYQSARDLRIELAALQDQADSGDEAGAGSGASAAAVTTRPEAPWIAVLPFQASQPDPEMASLADGLTEDITSGLARFPYLFVIARHSAARYQGQVADVRTVKDDLGARYVLEGTVRRGGNRIRLGIRVLDATTGTHLWAETYDRDLAASDLFTVQDELTDGIVSTVADSNGVLVRSMASPTVSRPPESLTPYEAVLRYFAYQTRISPEDHLVTRTALESAADKEPSNATVLACLALCVLDEDRHLFNPRPHALDRTLETAQRAVDADVTNQLAHLALAEAWFYRRDLGSFRAVADRAIALNPRDGNTVAMIGLLIGYSGDWERGREVARGAQRLNPHHPGWYRFGDFWDHYRRGEYQEALAVAQRINLPGYYWSHLVLALAHVNLGNDDDASAAVAEALRLCPDFLQRGRDEYLDRWLFAQPELEEKAWRDLLRAGLPGSG